MPDEYDLFIRLNSGNGPQTDEERFDDVVGRHFKINDKSPEELFNQEFNSKYGRRVK